MAKVIKQKTISILTSINDWLFVIFISLCLSVVISLLDHPSYAQEVEIGSLITERTISKKGHDLYLNLATQWRDIQNTQDVNIAITERLIPSSGTVLSIEVNHKLIYQTFLGRKRENIATKTHQALNSIIAAVASMRLNNHSVDLAENGW